jgi:hypothetical protein
VLIAAGSAWLGWSAAGEASVVRAEGGPIDDSDGDGLCDGIELVLGTCVDRADSDQDTFSDLEEVARGSNPLRKGNVPTLDGIAVSLDAFQQREKVHCITAIYLPDGDPHGKTLAFSKIAGPYLVPTSLSRMRGGHPIKVVPAKSGVGRIYVLDPVIPTLNVLHQGSFSLGATISYAGSPVAADAANLAVAGGELFEQVILGVAAGTPEPVMNVGLGIGGVYRPIGSGNSGGGSYVTGEICAQTTMVVGVVGAIVTQEVVDADCVPGWETSCAPGCASSVGSTLRTIDPAALVGG